ncbi:hypothetical protein KIM372_10720 [Bombiscardovia nodaiensis]|uniref:1-acyl-sn-glycerol-3-phosphate acyltransferase n=1 Tax=Bombiscardovia nodaiensis TaxID=2932181 RepID=A0ABM8B8P7_9BIFI|nr:hypothetical protein KIM372_10720 [Bombiscardovia nodaiensis]
MVYGEPILVRKEPVNEITHEEIRQLTDRIMREIDKLSGQEYLDMYAQVVKKRTASAAGK